MNQAQLIRNLALRIGQTQVDTKQLMKSSLEIIVDILDQDIPVSIPRLGTFYTVTNKKRKAYSPFHKQEMILPPKRVIRFRPSSFIKAEINSKPAE